MPETPSPYEQFRTLTVSVGVRMYERKLADAALFRLRAAQAQFKLDAAIGALCNCDGSSRLFAQHAKVQPTGLDHLDIEYARDTVIVAMTLLDSFITDLTRFLLLLKPSAVPKERQIRVGEALEAKDYASIVDLVVSKYLNELAYRTLRDRLLILQDKFGLPLPDQSLLSAVESASELRNQLIHNASRFRYAPSDERGSVRTTTRSLPAVDWPTAEKHHNAVVELVRYLFESVSRQIFKQEPEGELLRVLGGAPSL